MGQRADTDNKDWQSVQLQYVHGTCLDVFKSVMSVRPIMGVYFWAKKLKHLVNFPRAEHKPLEIDIYLLNRKKCRSASLKRILLQLYLLGCRVVEWWWLVVHVRSSHPNVWRERRKQPAESELWQHILLHTQQQRPDVTTPKHRSWPCNVQIRRTARKASWAKLLIGCLSTLRAAFLCFLQALLTHITWIQRNWSGQIIHQIKVPRKTCTHQFVNVKILSQPLSKALLEHDKKQIRGGKDNLTQCMDNQLN